MTVYYRLTENRMGLPEGATIREDQYKQIYYTDKCLFESVTDENIEDYIKYEDEGFCAANGIEFLLFYSQRELDKFLNSKFDATIID